MPHFHGGDTSGGFTALPQPAFRGMVLWRRRHLSAHTVLPLAWRGSGVFCLRCWAETSASTPKRALRGPMCRSTWRRAGGTPLGVGCFWWGGGSVRVRPRARAWMVYQVESRETKFAYQRLHAVSVIHTPNSFQVSAAVTTISNSPMCSSSFK